MAHFRTLFGIEVDHEFFEGDRCDGLDLRLDAASRSVVERAGLVVRHNSDGLYCYYDHDQLDRLRLWLGDVVEPLRLVVRASVRDPAFERYTEPRAEAEHAVLFLDTEHEEDGSASLAVVEAVTRAELDAAAADPDATSAGADARAELRAVALRALGERELLLPPVIALVVTIGARGLSEAPRHPFRLRFRARRTIWRYHLLGPLADRDAVIQDQSHEADRRVEFDPVGETRLPGNRIAKTFVSREPLPLRRRSGRRLQLRERPTPTPNGNGNGMGGRLLIRRLPVASPDGLSMAPIDGRETIVCDIFVNG